MVHDFFSDDEQKALIWVAHYFIQIRSFIRDLSDLITLSRRLFTHGLPGYGIKSKQVCSGQQIAELEVWSGRPQPRLQN